MVGANSRVPAGCAVVIGFLAPLAALGLLVIVLVAIATSGPQRINLYKPIDEAERIDDWLYLPELLYAVMLLMVFSAGAGPYSLAALILFLSTNVAHELSVSLSVGSVSVAATGEQVLKMRGVGDSAHRLTAAAGPGMLPRGVAL
jgi:hypothetical protein